MEFAADLSEWMPEDLARSAELRPDREDRRHPDDRGRQPVRRRPARRPQAQDGLRPPADASRSSPRSRAALEKIYRRGETDLQDLLEESDDGDLTVKEQLEEEVTDLGAISGENDAPIIKLVNLIIYQGIKAKASDIHVEPFEKRTIVRYRVDGAMHEAMSPPRKLQGAITSRLKIMASLDIAEKRRPQDGKFQVKVEGRQIDFRVSVLPTVHGEKVVLRILDSSNLAPQPRHAGLRADGALPTSRPRSTRPTG